MELVTTIHFWCKWKILTCPCVCSDKDVFSQKDVQEFSPVSQILQDSDEGWTSLEETEGHETDDSVDRDGSSGNLKSPIDFWCVSPKVLWASHNTETSGDKSKLF